MGEAAGARTIRTCPKDVSDLPRQVPSVASHSSWLAFFASSKDNCLLTRLIWRVTVRGVFFIQRANQTSRVWAHSLVPAFEYASQQEKEESRRKPGQGVCYRVSTVKAQGCRVDHSLVKSRVTSSGI